MAQNSNSSEIEDIISKSDLVCPGPPKIYQLKTKKEKIKSLTKVTVGEKNENKLKTILLVGETGAGKSNLVNALFNYAVGVKFEDEIWFQIVEEKEDRSQTANRTPDVVVYQIYGSEDQTLPFSLTTIDTPGYGDAGLKQQLLELFQSDDGIHEVHAVGLVIEEGGNVVSDQLKIIYDFILSQFGKDVEKNVIALLTNSNGKQPKKILQALEAANIKCAKNEKNQAVFFQFDNCQDEERTEDSELSTEYAWKLTERGMKQLTAFLGKSSPQQKKVLLDEQKDQIRLTACIRNLQERIKFNELKLRDVRMTQEALYNNKQKWKSDKNIKVTIPETYKHVEPLTDKRCGFETAVCCEICKENCHYPGCMTAIDSQQCEVMINGECTSCTNKCSAGEHWKRNCRFVIRTQKILKSKEELKKYYEQKQGGGEKKLSKSLETEKIELTAEKRQLINEAYRLFMKLYELVKNDESNDDSASTYVILDYLIKKMKGQGQKENLQKLKEIYSGMDQGTRTSLQYRIGMTSFYQEALISEGVQIHSGPPSIYQLITMKEMIGTLTRVTVGEKDENKINKTILLVGETGAGKSTMVNALFNYAVGVKFEDEVWFQIVEEEQKSQTKIQTSGVIVYQIFGFEGQSLPFSLTIIDTPGFEEDDSDSESLFDLSQSNDGVHEINAVGLVIKATDNRMSDQLRYIFDSVTSLFGNDLEENLVALITHSDGRPPENVLKALEDAKIKSPTDEMNQPVYFIFNNQQIEQRNRTEKDRQGSKYSWDFTNEEMGRLRDFLKKTKPQPLKAWESPTDRIRRIACIQNLQQRIKLTEMKQNEIKQIEEAYNKHEEQMKENKNFAIEVDEVYKDKETISGGRWGLVFYEGAVTCSVCEENCHYPGCTMAWKPEHCEVMKEGHCTVCTKKCPASKHVKENRRYVIKTIKVKQTLEKVKEKYETNKTQEKTIKLKKEWSSLLDEAYNHVIKLDQSDLNINSGFTLDHLVFLIEKMKEKGDKEKLEVLEKLKVKMEK